MKIDRAKKADWMHRLRDLLFLCILVGTATPQPVAAQSPALIKLPPVIVAGIPFQIEPVGIDGTPYAVAIKRDGALVFSQEGVLPAGPKDITLPHAGHYDITVTVGEQHWQSRLSAIAGFITLLPPLLAILIALVFRQVVLALFAGVWLGAFFLTDYSALRSFFYVVDHYVVDSLAGASGSDHVSIAIFTLMLGGMVGVFSRIGGTQGIVEKITHIATSPRRGQLATWLMGIVIFFDDYTNTLIVGNTMRPITDRLRISREKLAYIVDSTAAPVTCIAIITSWIGFEISLIKDSFIALAIDRNPFTTFVASIQYSFYPIVTLLFGLFVAVSTRDFGPMLNAEKRARTRGLLLAEKAMPLSNIDEEITTSNTDRPRWYNAAIPVLVVVLGTFVGLVVTGRASLIASGAPSFSTMDVIRESNSFKALLWSSLSGCTVAILLGVTQRLATLAETINAWVAGVKSMMTAIIILVLAWCIGAVCTDLHTADYLVMKVSGVISPRMLPMIIFLTAAAISFSTGTSWGTMTILTPISIPLVVRITQLNALSAGLHEEILLSAIAAILAGSVFGDHCSPISDTTIMSSMASASDHIDHVRTQLPYAITVALISCLLGYLFTGFGIPALVLMVFCAAAVFGILMIFGTPESSYMDAEDR